MKRQKKLLIGIAIGYWAKPIIQVVAKPLVTKFRNTLYNAALDFVQNFDADRPS